MVDGALQKEGAARQVILTLPHFHGVALAVARGHLIATVPLQFAHEVAKTNGLEIFKPPIDVPVPEIRLYWHKRHDRNPAHRWLREQIVNATTRFRTEQRA